MVEVLSTPHALEALVRGLRSHSPLSDEDCNAIKNLPVVIAKHRRTSIVFQDGEHTNQCAVVVKGFVQRFRTTSSGRRQILAIYVPGDPIDFDHLFLPIADDEAQALNDVELAYVRHQDLRDLLVQRPAVAEAVTCSLLVDSSLFREWIVNVGQRDAKARIAHLLCEVSARLESKGIEVDGLALPLTQDQIAHATGLTPVHVNRTLRALSEEGCIKRQGGLVMLPHPNGLRKVAGFNDRYLHLRKRSHRLR